MIKMPLDKEGVLPQKLSPAPHPPKNGFHPASNSSGPANPRLAKRRYSVGPAFKGLPKRRRRTNSESQSEPQLPSHFLLGGNIFDPLNLNSLLDEDVNKATNQETPQSSPLPSRGGDPIEILVPRDITDPLNLKGGGKEGKGEEGVLLSPLKSRKRHRHRHHGGGGGSDREAVPARLFPSASGPTVVTTGGSVSTSPLSCELNTAITCREDIAPPPILPRRHTHPPSASTAKLGNQRDGRHRRRHRTASTRSEAAAATVQPTKFQTPLVGGAKGSRCGDSLGSTPAPPRKKDKHRYQHGQHSCYYGYRGFYGDGWEGRVGPEDDPRLRLLEADWFRDKKVLDVGCGAGHVTLAIARHFNPSHILGVELDERLVHAAKQNIRHFLSHDLVVTERNRRNAEAASSSPPRKTDEEEEKGGMRVEEAVQEIRQALSLLPSFPLSLRVSRGPLSAPPLLPPSSSSSRFPSNITFIQGDYVSAQPSWPGRGRYHVILCLGLTKWLHLQAGDAGVVRLFSRVYQSLTPGGLFILQAQPWSRYNRSKRASETTFRHFRKVRLKPDQFTSYLTESVGFSSYRLLTHTGRKPARTGKQRPVYLFYKGPAHRK